MLGDCRQPLWCVETLDPDSRIPSHVRTGSRGNSDSVNVRKRSVGDIGKNEENGEIVEKYNTDSVIVSAENGNRSSIIDDDNNENSDNNNDTTLKNENKNRDKNKNKSKDVIDDFPLPRSTVGSSIVTLSVCGEIKIWQPKFSNPFNMKAKPDEIFGIFHLQFNLHGCCRSREIKLGSNNIPFSRDDKYHTFHDGKVRETTLNDLSKNKNNNINNNSVENNNSSNNNDDNTMNKSNHINKSDRNGSQKSKISTVFASACAVDPSCRSVIVSYSNGSLEVWPIVGDLGLRFHTTHSRNKKFNSGNIFGDINQNGEVNSVRERTDKIVICTESSWTSRFHTGISTVKFFSFLNDYSYCVFSFLLDSVV